MACQTIDFGNGVVAIVCGPRRQSRCVYCGNSATKLCDGPARKAGQKTCDKALCNRCATPVGKDRDLCREHAQGRKEPMKDWLKGRTVVVKDVETTGLSPMRDRVVQLGAAVFVDGELKKKWSTLVNPGIPIPEEVSKIHGITDASVKDAPTFGQAWDGLLIDVLSAVPTGAVPLLVAHNSEFDQSFLVAEAMRSLQAGAFLLTNRWFCTMALSKALKNVGKYEKGYRLVDLCDKAKIPFDGKAHDAANDAEAAGRLLYFIQKWLPDTEDEVYEKQLAWWKANRM